MPLRIIPPKSKWPPIAEIMCPPLMMRGPLMSPASTAFFSSPVTQATMLKSPASRTVVNPLFRTFSQADTPTRASAASFRDARFAMTFEPPVRWIWVSINPGMTNFVDRSTILASAGRATLLPMAAILPSTTRISAGPSGLSAKPSQTFPARITRVCFGAASASVATDSNSNIRNRQSSIRIFYPSLYFTTFSALIRNIV